MKDNLPNTLFGLLRTGVTDLRKAVRNPDYRIDMTVYHEFRDDLCYVCMAGAALAFTNNVPRRYNVGNLPDRTLYKLHAIDFMRTGDMVDAYNKLYNTVAQPDQRAVLLNVEDTIKQSMKSDFYYKHSVVPAEVYLGVADVLEANGL